MEKSEKIKTELTKLLLQSIDSIGYKQTSQILRRESNLELDCQILKQLDDLVTNGRWTTLLQVVQEQLRNKELKRAIYKIQKQKYLEQLKNNEHVAALETLRKELVIYCEDQSKLAKLSELLILQSNQLKNFKKNRKKLKKKLIELFNHQSGYIDEPNRLFKLIFQGLQQQIRKCYFHDDNQLFCISNGILKNHSCKIRYLEVQQLDNLKTNEIKILIVNKEDNRIAIFDNSNRLSIYQVYEKKINKIEISILIQEQDGIIYEVIGMQWIDSQYLIVGGNSRLLKVIRVSDMKVVKNIESIHYDQTRFLKMIKVENNFAHFITVGLDLYLGLWKIRVDGIEEIDNQDIQVQKYKSIRILDIIINNSGSQLLILSGCSKMIVIIGLQQQQQRYCLLDEYYIQEQKQIRYWHLQNDNKLLLNVDNEIHLWDLEYNSLKNRYYYECNKIRQISMFMNYVLGSDIYGNILIYHSNSQQINQCLELHELNIQYIQWIGPSLLTVSDDHFIKLWDIYFQK